MLTGAMIFSFTLMTVELCLATGLRGKAQDEEVLFLALKPSLPDRASVQSRRQEICKRLRQVIGVSKVYRHAWDFISSTMMAMWIALSSRPPMWSSDWFCPWHCKAPVASSSGPHSKELKSNEPGLLYRLRCEQCNSDIAFEASFFREAFEENRFALIGEEGRKNLTKERKIESKVENQEIFGTIGRRN